MNFLSINITNLYLLIIIFLFFLSLFILKWNISLIKENRKLKKIINTPQKEEITSLPTNDTIPIKNISTDKNIEKNITPPNINIDNNIENEYISKEESDFDNDTITKNNKTKKEYYSKNTLQNKKRITSPISINDNFDLNEFIKKDTTNSYTIKENNTKNKNYDYLKEISDKLEQEIESKTIELTDYEKKQEENAIISYKELLKIKDNLKCEEDDEEITDEFIDALKNFRDSLK